MSYIDTKEILRESVAHITPTNDDKLLETMSVDVDVENEMNTLTPKKEGKC